MYSARILDTVLSNCNLEMFTLGKTRRKTVNLNELLEAQSVKLIIYLTYVCRRPRSGKEAVVHFTV